MLRSPVIPMLVHMPTRKAKLRILFLINNLAGGGAERVLVNLVNAMDASRYDITLRTLFDEGDNRKRLSPSVRYETVFRRRFRGVNLLALIPGNFVYNHIAGGNFDVIVVYLHGVLTRIVASAPVAQKTVAYLHADMRKSPFMRSFRSRERIQKCFQTYDAIVAVSESVAESFRQVSGLSSRLRVIYNAFDTEMIRKKAFEAPDKQPLYSPCLMTLCAVGKLVEVKGYDRLLRVAQRLHAEGLQFRLLVVGDGPLRPALQAYIDDHALNTVVTLVGYDENPYKYMSRADLFVSSSYSEGFSSVVVESIVLGVPVLATDCAGMREILGEKNEYGVVVENTEAALFSGLRTLILHPGTIASYRGKLAERASEFEMGKAVGDVEELLDSLMAGVH